MLTLIQTLIENGPIVIVWTADDWVKIITAIFVGLNTVIAGIGATISAVNYRRGRRTETTATEQTKKIDGMVVKLDNGLVDAIKMQSGVTAAAVDAIKAQSEVTAAVVSAVDRPKS